VLLPRRIASWPAPVRCRYKGKAVIVRIGKLTPSSLKSLRWGSWSRRVVSALALMASLAALAFILNGQYGDWSTASEAVAASSEAESSVEIPKSGAGLTQAEEARARALSEFVAKRYRVSQDVAFDLVTHAHRVGRQLQLDPLLIIAVISIESRFNPIAESVAGAKGLMQIIPKYHGDRLEEFGGEQAVFNPEANIEVGSQILREYIRRTGNVNIALQMYAGALDDYEDRYTRKVLNERQRLLQVLGKDAPAQPTAVKTASRRAASATALVLPTELD
jgi:soluble lytic murein transglycosylase-like protein